MSVAEKTSLALKRTKAMAAGKHILKSNMLSRADRELLLANGWLQEIIRGWYMLVRPDVAKGDSAAWYANFWDFMALYLKERFNDDYCLAAEASLDLHTAKSTIPKQLIVIAGRGSGITQLMHNTSILVITSSPVTHQHKTIKNNLYCMDLAYALCKATPSYFLRHPREAELALHAIQHADELIQIIIKYDFKAAAARLAGAYQFLGKSEFAQRIIQQLKKFGLSIKANNPFIEKAALLGNIRIKSTCAARVKAIWAETRNTVIKYFPEPPGISKNADSYLNNIDTLYQSDAYNSLSIEGYQVDDTLIERVQNKLWQPDTSLSDNLLKNALAARGYYDTFKLVKKSIKHILAGKDAAEQVRKNLHDWYQALFGPAVQAGIIDAAELFGYRSNQVYIRNSIHTPPPKEALVDAMTAFFECLEDESHAGVRAVLAHYIFVWIHPFMDGNGRIARFMMNALLAAGGYPWTVIRVSQREHYINTLESTHHELDLSGFTRFIAAEMANHAK